MSFSGGIAAFPADADNMDKLLDKADKAMYFSKKHYQGTTTQYSKITGKKFSQFVVAAVVILIVLGLFFGRGFIVKGKISEVFKSIVKKGAILISSQVPASAPAPAVVSTPKIREEQLDTIYLKLGGAMKGIITRQSPTETEIKLKMDRGEGVLIFKNSDIQSIERGKR
jgi:hypothetical protein